MRDKSYEKEVAKMDACRRKGSRKKV